MGGVVPTEGEVVNEGPYREPPAPTRGEFEELKGRVAALEKEPPKKAREPFELRGWHVAAVAFAVMMLGVLGAGLAYDHVHASGLQVALITVFALVAVCGFCTTLYAVMDKGVKNPW